MAVIKIVPMPGVAVVGPQGIQGPAGPQGIQGPVGATGPAGNDGADALWNFLGEYNGGADYNIGDVVTYNGGTYYRVLPLNAGYPPGTEYWTPIAEKGADAVLPTGATGSFTIGNQTFNITNGIITSIDVNIQV